jgi:hypothetical protein
VDVARADAVDAELERLVSKRALRDRRPNPDELEPSYMKSVNRHNARKREENRQAWREYHQGQAARHRGVLEQLIARHEAEAERLAP